MFSHFIPLLVWVAWPVWEKEEHVVLSIVAPVVVCKTLLHLVAVVGYKTLSHLQYMKVPHIGQSEICFFFLHESLGNIKPGVAISGVHFSQKVYKTTEIEGFRRWEICMPGE